MRKLFFFIIIIVSCIAIYFGVKMFIDYMGDVYIVMVDSYNDSATSGNFAFKNTPENLELVNSYLKVNSKFVKEESKEILLEENIKNIYSLSSGFPTYKDYYSGRLKLEKAVFEGLPYLIDNAINLSSNDLKEFFNDNLEYLDSTFGINDFEQFNNVVTNLNYLQNKNIEYAEIPKSSAIYNPYGANTGFRIKVGSNSNDFVYFSVNAYHAYDTKNQKAPVIVFSALGGMS